MGNFVPETYVLDLPFLFDDYQQARCVLDGPIGQELLDKIDQNNLVGLAWTENGWEKRLDETSGMPLLTEKPVAGFRDRTNGIRCYGNLGVTANEAGMVATVFGDKPFQEESDSPKCCDVSGVPTPRSDGSDHSQERFCLR